MNKKQPNGPQTFLLPPGLKSPKLRRLNICHVWGALNPPSENRTCLFCLLVVSFSHVTQSQSRLSWTSRLTQGRGYRPMSSLPTTAVPRPGFAPRGSPAEEPNGISAHQWKPSHHSALVGLPWASHAPCMCLLHLTLILQQLSPRGQQAEGISNATSKCSPSRSRGPESLG